MRWSADVAHPSVRRLDAILIGSVLVLSAVSLAAWLGPPFAALSDARALDIAINVSAVLIGGGVAILGWVRWRDNAEPAALYVCSAFVALTVVNALMVAVVLAGREEEFGLSARRPGDAPVYLWTVTRLTAAYLLMVGALRGLRQQRLPLSVPLLVAGPCALLLGVGAMLFGREAVLPPMPGIEAFDPRRLANGLSFAATMTGAIQVAIFGAFIVAAILFRRLYIRDRRISDGYLAVGLVIAAFSQLHFLLAPVVAIGVVTSTDALRLVFYGVLMLGIQAELGADLRALRAANVELARLREVDSANAALAERARLARDIHDGLAQDLWYAKLKQGRLAQAPALRPEDRRSAKEALQAIESALSEARQAVMAMRVDGTTASSLRELLHSSVEDFSNRFGIRADFESDKLPRLASRTEAEILRIVQEALNNVQQHADATRVRVRGDRLDETVRISVTDNGLGFDPAAVSRERYGLRGMRERAELVGGSLKILSRPSDGTTITIEVPVTLDRDGSAP